MLYVSDSDTLYLVNLEDLDVTETEVPDTETLVRQITAGSGDTLVVLDEMIEPEVNGSGPIRLAILVYDKIYKSGDVYLVNYGPDIEPFEYIEATLAIDAHSKRQVILAAQRWAGSSGYDTVLMFTPQEHPDLLPLQIL